VLCCELLPIRLICGVDSKLGTRQCLRSALSECIHSSGGKHYWNVLPLEGIYLPLTTGEASSMAQGTHNLIGMKQRIGMIGQRGQVRD